MMIRSGFLTMLSGACAAVWTPLTVVDYGPGAREDSGASFSDADLKSFVIAALEVERISDTYLPKLKAAKTAEEQQQVESAASREMVKAVENKGISVDKYQEIATEAQANPAIAARVKQHIKDIH